MIDNGDGTFTLFSKTVNILGTEYTIIVKKYDEDEYFARAHCCGYCESFCRQIILCDMSTYKDWEHESAQNIEMQQKLTLRYEIVHAFFNESGLSTSSNPVENAWARNEEMVDWIGLLCKARKSTRHGRRRGRYDKRKKINYGKLQ